MKMFKCILIFLFFILFSFQVNAQKGATKLKRPKLIIGIVIDQMRYDYLYRYWDKLSNTGLKKLLNQGTNCTNVQYNYVPTYTGPGHTSIFTGTTPAIHGIIANNWYQLNTKQNIYCAQDNSVSTIGSANLKVGAMSPNNLLTTTMADEIQMHFNFKCKTIGIALKDRGAILPVGHTANAAYWFDGSSGNWVTSSYYMKALPTWLTEFNKQQWAAQYLKQDWNMLLSKEHYTESTIDSTAFESNFKKEKYPIFPHALPVLIDTVIKQDLIRATPFGNTITRLMAQECMIHEALGQDDNTDLLTVSFSSPDYIGHQFGPNSIEVEDNYIRLDQEISLFLEFIEKNIDKKNVLLFLTADHGAANAVGFNTLHHIPAGVIKSQIVFDTLKKKINERFKSTDLLLAFENQQLYVNKTAMQNQNISEDEFNNFIKQNLMQINGVANVLTIEELQLASQTPLYKNIINGYNAQRSGDIMVIYNPGWLEDMDKGTTHGSFYNYDTHVPLLFWGWQIPHFELNTNINITDITPTICNWLHIQEPNGTTGKVLSDIHLNK